MLCVSERRGADPVHLEPEKEALQIITDHLSLNWLEDFALVFEQIVHLNAVTPVKCQSQRPSHKSIRGLLISI